MAVYKVSDNTHISITWIKTAEIMGEPFGMYEVDFSTGDQHFDKPRLCPYTIEQIVKHIGLGGDGQGGAFKEEWVSGRDDLLKKHPEEAAKLFNLEM